MIKIIVIDDEMEALSNFLTEIIKNQEIEYKFFLEHPLQALDYCKNNNVDAAFLDIKMPEINGIDLALKLQQINKDIKIIFITGFTYDEKQIRREFGDNLLGFCYKPFAPEEIAKYISEIANKGNRDISFKTFGSFDLFINGQALEFRSTKAKELLALLVTYNGSTVTMGEAISRLWPEKPVDRAKKLYRDAIWRLRKVLDDNGIGYLVEFMKAKTVIRKGNCQCDFWNFLDHPNDSNVDPLTFMQPYDWGFELISTIYGF